MLVGSFPREPVYTVLATIGIVFAALYVLWVYQRTMPGPVRGAAVLGGARTRASAARAPMTATRRDVDPAIAARRDGSGFPDLSGREITVLTPLIVLILVLGFFPGPVLDVINPSVAATMNEVGLTDPVGRSGPVSVPWRSAPGGPGERRRRSTTRAHRAAADRARRGLPRGARRGVPAAAPALAGAGRAHASPRWAAPGSRSALYAGGSPPEATTTLADALAVDRPTLFLWGTLLALGLGSVLLIADRSVEPGGAFVASAAAARGGRRLGWRRRWTPAEPSRGYGSPDQAPTMQTEVFPLTLFALGGMMTFVAANDLLTMFVALEVLEPAAVPDVRAGPAAPAAVAGGGGQVLPARARSPRRSSSTGSRCSTATPARCGSPTIAEAAGRLGPLGRAAVRRARAAAWSACCSRPRSARSTPGRRTSTRARRRRSPRSWRPAPRSPRSARCCGCCTWRSATPAGSGAAVLWAVAVVSMVIGAVIGLTQTDIKRMLAYSSVAHAGFMLLGAMAITPQAGCPARCSTC